MFRQNVKGITDEALELLAGYDWPGNVRELQNAVERAMAYGSGTGYLNKEDFQRFGGFQEPQYKQDVKPSKSPVSEDPMEETPIKKEKEKTPPERRDTIPASADARPMHDNSLSLSDVKDDTEKKIVLAALKECGGNKSKAAKLLGISRTMLYKKLEKYDIR